MNREQFLAALQAEFAFCLEISKKKNSDYGGSTDPFRNFRAAELLGVPNDSAILIRMSDKMARIGTLLEKARKGEAPAVVDESLEDTLRDLANYAMILLLFLRANAGEDKRVGIKCTPERLAVLHPNTPWAPSNIYADVSAPPPRFEGRDT